MKWLLIAAVLYGHEGGALQSDTRDMQLRATVYKTEAECLKQSQKIKDNNSDYPVDAQCVKL